MVRRFTRRNQFYAIGLILAVFFGGVLRVERTPTQRTPEQEKARGWCVRLTSAKSYAEALDAMDALKGLGAEGAEAVLESLGDPSLSGASLYLKEALVVIGEPAVGPLMEFIDDGHQPIWDFAGYLPKPVARLVEPVIPDSYLQYIKLSKPGPFEILAQVAPRSEVVLDYQRDWLRAGDPFLGQEALRSLARMDESLDLVLLEVFEGVLRDRKDWGYAGTLWVIGELGPRAEPLVEGIIPYLRSPDSLVRSGTAKSLGDIGRSDPGVVAALRVGLKDPEVTVRTHCAAALLKLGKRRPEAAAVLVQNLSDNAALVQTLKVLGELPDVLPECNELIAGYVERGNSLHRIWALECLWQRTHDEDRLLPMLLAYLHADESRERYAALSSLGRLKPTQKKVVPELIRMVRIGDTGKVIRAIEVLGEMGPAASAAGPILTERLTDPNPAVQRAAHLALESIRGQARGE